MEKVKDSNNTNFYALDSLDLALGFDEIAREKVEKQLNKNPPKNSLDHEISIYWMLFLYKGIFS